ncbi:MAG: hypothetical protein STHCBS139747_001886 [Sporothrix thermara]
MGGSAFASGADALYTPRMSPAVYTAVRDRCQAVLFGLFAAVATPIEGPGKKDFGDVDIIMALPLESKYRANSSGDGVALLIREAVVRLGAVRSHVVAHEGKASIAVPWPVDLVSLGSSAGDDKDDKGDDSDAAVRVAHIQIDLTIAPALKVFHWALFRHAHGDVWNILGATVLRPLGLTINEQALWLRVPEIEQAHRNRAKVLLTDEPETVLHFLGLSIMDQNAGYVTSLWEQPFASATDLFEYITTSRFFVLPDEGDDKNSDVHRYSGDLSALKANDRRRMLYRPLFRQWITEYLPSLQVAAAAAAAAAAASASNVAARDRLLQPEKVPQPVTRESVREAAFAYFPGTEVRFEAKRTAWLRERHLLAIRTAVKEAVPAGLPSQVRGEVCAAVRRHLGLVMDKNTGADGADGADNAAAAAAAAWTVESVSAHVAANWSAISAAEAPLRHGQYQGIILPTKRRAVND